MAVSRPEPATLAARLADGGRPLAVLLAIALLFKLLVVAAALQGDPLVQHPTSDERYYLDRAAEIAGLVPPPRPAEPHHLPPLYPHVLAALPGALEGRYGPALAFQSVCGALTLLGCWALCRARTSQQAALLATALLLAYAPPTFFETQLLGDTLATTLLTWLLVAADALAGRPTAARGALAGVLVSLAALLRPQALLLLPVLGLWALRRRVGAGLALLVAGTLVLLPSTLHNLRAGAGLAPVSDNGGVNLWLANTGPPSGTFRTDVLAFGEIAAQAEAARAVAEARAGRPLSPAEVGAELTAAALSAIVADPALFARRVALRALALLESFETGIVAVPEVEMRLVPPLRAAALPFGVLAGLACAGWVLRGAGGRGRATGAAPPGLPLLAVTLMVALTALLFFHYSRFRLPLLPALAIGTASLVDAVRARRLPPLRTAAAALLAVGLAVVSFRPAGHHENTRAIGWVSVAEARLARAARGDLAAVAAALDDAERALVHDPGLGRALLVKANASFTLGHYDDAAAALRPLLEGLPDHPPALMTAAWLAATPHPANRHFDPDRARELLERLRPLAQGDEALAGALGALEQQLARDPR